MIFVDFYTSTHCKNINEYFYDYIILFLKIIRILQVPRIPKAKKRIAKA